MLAFRRRHLEVVPPAAADIAPAPAGVAFVLSGGGNLGAAQVGAILALLGAGIVPDVVVGCSVGGLNAAYLAADPTLDQALRLADVWRSLSNRAVFGTRKHRVVLNAVRGHDHLMEPGALRGLISRFAPYADLADAVIPCHIVTTDLDAGRATWFSSGAPEDVLAASAALPGLFPPVEMNGHLHVDGGVLDPVPVGRAVALGMATTYVLDVSSGTAATGVRDPRRPHSALDVLIRSFEVSRVVNTPAPQSFAGPGQEVVEVPMADTSGLDLRDFSHTPRLIEETRAVVAAFLASRAAAAA